MNLEFPWEEDVKAAAYSLLFLPLTYNFHPIVMVDGQHGSYYTNDRLRFDDVTYITRVCLNSTYSIFESGIVGDPYRVRKPTTHYAMAIEWTEAAEM